jgi:hypothetical protein
MRSTSGSWVSNFSYRIRLIGEIQKPFVCYWGRFLLTLIACLLLLSGVAVAGVGNLCVPHNDCIIKNPVYVNVYWDTSAAQWDTDVSTGGPGMTEERIDAFTTALLHSSYFSQLAQYGVAGVSGVPSITATGCAPPPANVDTGISHAVSLIQCVLATHRTLANPGTIFNLFFPPQTINTSFCNPDSTGAHVAAEHLDSNWPAGPAYTIIPTTGACNSSFNTLMVSLSHEMVEAATDPATQALSGWKVPFDGEIGDLCESASVPLVPFLFSTVQQYWSNSAKACVTGFANLTPVTIAAPATVCGTGPNMRIVVNGTFGPTPWDILSNQFSGQSLYVRVAISGQQDNWTAGNFDASPPDTVGLGNVTWVQSGGPGGSDQIQIFGFNSAYRSSSFVVNPGDTVTVIIAQPLNGITATTPVVAPGASQLGAPMFVKNLSGLGSTAQVTGTLVDSAGCTVQGANVVLSASSDVSLLSTTATTDASGTFVVGFTAPDVAGRATISMTSPFAASTFFDLLPVLDSLHWDQGATSGLQTTSLKGNGFDSSTSVLFGPNNSATVQAISTDHTTVTLITPASPLPKRGVGLVGVGATVNNEPGSGLQYRYIVTGVPVLQFIGSIGSGEQAYSCNTGQFTVNVYAADGAPQSVPVALFARYPAFWSGIARGGVLGPGHFVSSETVRSGATVVIKGGGPVSASNPQVPGSQVTQSFPVLTPGECAYITSFWGQVGHGVFLNPGVYHPISPECVDDCGVNGIRSVLWGDAEDSNLSRNFVAIEGTNPAAIMNSFQVSGVSEQLERSLVSASPFVMAARQPGNKAEFLGPAIQIERVEREKVASSSTRISELCRISFSMPSSSPIDGTYAIVHLRTVGKAQAWISDSPSVVDRRRGVITTVAKSTGTYALVRTSATQP